MSPHREDFGHFDEALGLRCFGQGPQAIRLEGKDVVGCCVVVFDEEALAGSLHTEGAMDVATAHRAHLALLGLQTQSKEGFLWLRQGREPGSPQSGSTCSRA